MNFKNFLISITLASLTLFALEYFIIRPYLTPGNGAQEVKSGQSFVAPQSPLEAQPLNKEVNFSADEAGDSSPAVQTRIETESATYIFSNKGACLEQLVFKRHMNGELITLKTIETPQDLSRENNCFLVGLDTNTPYNFTLVDHDQGDAVSHVTYRGQTDHAIIDKMFTINHAQFKIDLVITITPKKEPVQARIFFSSPSLGLKGDVVSDLYNNQKGSVVKKARAKVDPNTGWFAPTLFGSDDRYFIHAMVTDPQHFAQRAYYSLVGQTRLISILESAPITVPTTWTVSFYCGPKEESVMTAVDPRLEQTLDYSGILAPISRALLWILNYLYRFLHNYGWAIVILTMVINLILLPLNLFGSKSFKKYADFQKKLAYLQQRYKNDPDTLARERAELINKNGMPGAAGCLPKLLQLPIFFALSRVLSSAIQLYKAPFLWISDLSATDPYYILPVLIGSSMLFLAPTNDPKQRFTMIAMALFFGAFSANLSAGLSLYIFVGVLLGVIQNFFQQKMGWA